MTATTNNKILNIIVYILIVIFAIAISYDLGVSNKTTDYVPIIYNNTIERVELKECSLSCLDEQNKGYLEGVSECEMNELYVTAVNGRIRSYVDNTEGFYSGEGVICLQVEGRSSDQVMGTLVHELIHRGIYEFNQEHFCEGG